MFNLSAMKAKLCSKVFLRSEELMSKVQLVSFQLQTIEDWKQCNNLCLQPCMSFKLVSMSLRQCHKFQIFVSFAFVLI